MLGAGLGAPEEDIGTLTFHARGFLWASRVHVAKQGGEPKDFSGCRVQGSWFQVLRGPTPRVSGRAPESRRP